MDKLYVSYFDGKKVLKTIIKPTAAKMCPACGDPLDFHVCRKDELDRTREELDRTRIQLKNVYL